MYIYRDQYMTTYTNRPNIDKNTFEIKQKPFFTLTLNTRPTVT